jgi:hypothetical protein
MTAEKKLPNITVNLNAIKQFIKDGFVDDILKDLGWVKAEPTDCNGCIFLDKHKKIDISARGWWCDKYGFNFYHQGVHPNMICLSRLTKGDLCEYCKDIETCNAKQARGKECFFQPVGDKK